MKNAIIIRYCEIHLKGKNRGFFEKMLKVNIKDSLKEIPHTFTAMHSRYLIEDFSPLDLPLIEDKLKKLQITQIQRIFSWMRLLFIYLCN